ncbi:hypothetical protein HYFRA_00001510 [Hymenoscyphus fraxineus]|uniref:Uncharacterized protein n=1 Tax=Hymenoscyphus fraxineus TaxID=746836 RepID=A0A9N9L7T4_9HELO|nr:hypothetical protein HYFRA_00001510 [Hymenoscyphus fraxineus]
MASPIHRDAIIQSEQFRSTLNNLPGYAEISANPEFARNLRQFQQVLERLFSYNRGLRMTPVGYTSTGFVGFYVEAPEVIGGLDLFEEIPLNNEPRKVVDVFQAVLRLMPQDPNTPKESLLRPLPSNPFNRAKEPKSGHQMGSKDVLVDITPAEISMDKCDPATVFTQGFEYPVEILCQAFKGEDIRKILKDGPTWVRHFMEEATTENIESCLSTFNAYKDFVRQFPEKKDSDEGKIKRMRSEECRSIRYNMHMHLGGILKELLPRIRKELGASDAKRSKAEANLAKATTFKAHLEAEVTELKEERLGTKRRHEAAILSNTASIEELETRVALADKKLSSQKASHEHTIEKTSKNFEKMKALGLKYKEEAKVASLNLAHSEEKVAGLEDKLHKSEADKAELRKELQSAREENKKLLSQRSNPRVEADIRQKAVLKAVAEKEEELDSERAEVERLRAMVQAQDERAREMYAQRQELLARLGSFEEN